MTSPNENPTQDSQASAEREPEIRFLDIAILLARRKRFLLGFPLGAAIAAAIVSLLLPNIYVATTKILPPQPSQSSTAALLAQFGALMGGLGGGTGGAVPLRNPNDLYVGMLKSRTVADKLIARFDLQKVYDKDRMSDARSKLANKTLIVSGRDGIITVEVENEDPKRAAAIANAYAEELYNLTSTLAVTEASQRRLFFESQLKQTRDQLAQAELSLRQAIDKGGLAGVDVQSRAILEPSAQLRAQIALREVQVSALRIFATEQHPDITRLRHEISAMKRELAKLEGGDGETRPAATSAGFENLRRFKDVKFLERLAELLTQQFEAAKIDEAKDISIVQVLDKAVEPDRRTKPKRALIVLVTALIASLVSVVWIVAREALDAARREPRYAKRLQLLRDYLSWNG